jgi:hypothetical protein
MAESGGFYHPKNAFLIGIVKRLPPAMLFGTPVFLE